MTDVSEEAVNSCNTSMDYSPTTAVSDQFQSLCIAKLRERLAQLESDVQRSQIENGRLNEANVSPSHYDPLRKVNVNRSNLLQ